MSLPACRAGCKLAVEMFFPQKEFPTPALEAALNQLGVLCRRGPQSWDKAPLIDNSD